MKNAMATPVPPAAAIPGFPRRRFFLAPFRFPGALLITLLTHGAASGVTLEELMQQEHIQGVVPNTPPSLKAELFRMGGQAWEELLCLFVLGLLGMGLGWVKATGRWTIDDIIKGGIFLPAGFEGSRIVLTILTGYAPGPFFTGWLAAILTVILIRRHYRGS